MGLRRFAGRRVDPLNLGRSSLALDSAVSEHPRPSSIRPLTLVIVALLAAAAGGGVAYWLAAPSGGGGAQAAAGGPGESQAGGPGGDQGGPPPALVRLASAEARPVQRRTRIVGQLEPVQRATVAAEVEGRVIAMPVEAGDAVTGGETVLAEIDEVFVKLDLAAAEADVLAAEATLEQSESDLAELEELQRRNSATQKEVTDQRAEVKANRARLDAAIADRDRAREAVDRLRVIAPFDGVVIEKMTEVGQWLDPGSAVAEVISRGEIDARVDVPEQYVNAVGVGMSVVVIVEPLGERVTGEVVSVNPRGAAAARTFPVEIRLSDRDGALKPGMSVTAEIPLSEQQEMLTVPRDAVQFSEQQGATVWAAVAMGQPMPQAVPLPVEVLFGAGDAFVVEPRPAAMGPPLSAGQRVVIEGAERLFPTQPLREMDRAEADAEADPEPGSSRPAGQASASPREQS